MRKRPLLFTYLGFTGIFSFFALYIGTHSYLLTLLGITQIPRFLLLGVILFLSISYPLSRFVNQKQIGAPWIQILLTRFGHLWLGILWMLVLTISIVHIINISLRLGGLDSFSADTVAKSILALTFFITFWGMQRAYRSPTVVEYTIDRRERYQKNRSLTIVHLSDMHIGYDLGGRFLRKVVDATNQLNPDLIVLTGDIMECSPEYFERFGEDFQGFKARLGTFAVTGNHDFYNGVIPFMKIMEESQISVLQNELVRFADGAQLIGVHDPTGKRMTHLGKNLAPNWEKALNPLHQDAPSILLVHQPTQYEMAVDKEVDLILSGHTHRGQIFPFHMIAKRLYEHISGNHEIASNTNLIISQGTGFWGPPLRIGADSQIVKIELLY